MSPANVSYAQSQGLKLLQAAVELHGPLFTLDELQRVAAEQSLTNRQVTSAVSNLARSGWLEILKRGVYLVKSPLFAEEVHPFAISAALVQPVAISHWSALAQHGFTTQLPRMVQASTPTKIVTPEMRQGHAYRPRGRSVWQAGGVEVEFIHTVPERFFGHQRIWINRWRQIAITDPERTALDLIARADIFGGMVAAIELFENALAQIRVGQLVKYALRYGEGAVIKRLGWTLEQLGVSPENIEPLRAVGVRTYYRLDPKARSTGQHNSRWHIIENLQGGRNA